MGPRAPIVALAVTAAVLAACASESSSPPAGGTEPIGTTAIVAHLTCEADGSTSLAETDVLAQPDGVHLEVRNRLDEPASVNGLGMDVDPGRSEWTLAIAPGEHQVACWPFSDHGSGEEPPTTPLTVLDPEGLYVAPIELDCEVRWSAILDYFSDVEGIAPDPVGAARETLTGLRSDDVLTESPSGYPQEERPPSVLVIRDEVPIVEVSVFQGSDGGWLVGGASGCDGTGVNLG